MAKVYILRGIPGAGKSTWAEGTDDPPGVEVVCSADHYMVNSEGGYEFRADMLSAAHEKCLRKFVDEIKWDDVDGVIVDNTNILTAEIAPYYQVAKARGHDVRIVQFMCDPAIAASRNIHGVSAQKIWQMYQNLLTEKLPAWWNVEIVWTNQDFK